MNIIAWLAFANIVTSGLLLTVCYRLRKDINALDEQNVKQYRHMQEIIVGLLKLKEIQKHN
jgi:hypothetical protein